MSYMNQMGIESMRGRVSVSNFKSSGENLTMGGSNGNTRSDACIKVSNILAERALKAELKDMEIH